MTAFDAERQRRQRGRSRRTPTAGPRRPQVAAFMSRRSSRLTIASAAKRVPCPPSLGRQSAARCAPGWCRRRVAGSRLLCRLLAPRAQQSATSARTSSHGTISRASATVGAVHSPIGDQQILRSVIRSIPSSGHRCRRSSSPQGAPRSQRRSARRLPISRRASSPSQNREWTISRSRGVARTGNPASVEGLR